MGLFDFIGDIFGFGAASKAASTNKKINAQNIAFQQATNLENYQRSKEFAQNSVLWRVQDAKQAGIHPLYAFGAPTFSPSTSVAPFNAGGSDNRGDYLASFGQNIGRSIQSMLTREERAEQARMATIANKIELERGRLGLENMALQNQLLGSQIARSQADQIGPPAPSPTLNPSGPRTPDERLGRTWPRPTEPRLSASTNPAREAGHITDYGYVRQNDGGLGIVQSADMKERTEDSLIDELLWNWRNRVTPAITGLRAPSLRDYPLPPNHVWRWDPVRQAFYPFNTVVPSRR